MFKTTLPDAQFARRSYKPLTVIRMNFANELIYISYSHHYDS